MKLSPSFRAGWMSMLSKVRDPRRW